jgi:hypothetical protein
VPRATAAFEVSIEMGTVTLWQLANGNCMTTLFCLIYDVGAGSSTLRRHPTDPPLLPQSNGMGHGGFCLK